jgi:hypothetical protein
MPDDDTPIANTVKEIIKIDDKHYRFDGSYIFIEDQDKYELVEQKFAEWSEEDDYNLQCCIAKVQSDIDNGRIGRNRELLTWLNYLKEREHLEQEWKPSEEQMDALSSMIATCSDTERGNYLRDMLINLYDDLKKL